MRSASADLRTFADDKSCTSVLRVIVRHYVSRNVTARERVIGGITIRFFNGNAFSAYLANYVMGPLRGYLYSSALMVTVLPMRALVILYSEAFISFAFCAITASAESSVVPVAVTLCADALNAATEKREAVKLR